MPIKACTKTSVPASIRQTKKSTTIYLPNISWTTDDGDLPPPLLLDQNIDEAGAAFESQGKQIALSINQGDSRFNNLCQKPPPLRPQPLVLSRCLSWPRYYLRDEISNRKPALHHLSARQLCLAGFHGERPDPMPHYEMTGNPVSIAFSEQSPPVKMRSFKLYRDTKKSETSKS